VDSEHKLGFSKLVFNKFDSEFGLNFLEKFRLYFSHQTCVISSLLKTASERDIVGFLLVEFWFDFVKPGFGGSCGGVDLFLQGVIALCRGGVGGGLLENMF